MKKFIPHVTSFLLFCLYSTVFATNPDSTIAQSSSSSKKQDVQKRDTNVQGDARPSAGSQSGFYFFSSMPIQAIKTASAVTELVVDRVLPFGYVFTQTRNYQNGRTNVAVRTIDNAGKIPISGRPIGPVNSDGTFNRGVNTSRARPEEPVASNPQLTSKAETVFSNSDPNFSINKNAAENPSIPSPAWSGSNEPSFNSNPGNREYASSIPPKSNYPINAHIASDISNSPDTDSQNARQNPIRSYDRNRNSGRPPSYPLRPRLGNRGPGRFPNTQPNNFANPNGPKRNENSPSSTTTNTAANGNRRISPDSNLYAGIINDFAFKLVNTLNLESNFVISPLSIFIALSMCYLGSEGSTKAQLENVLGMNSYAVHGNKLHEGIRDLVRMILPQSEEYQLYLANGMFLGKNLAVDPEFESEMQKFYAAELKNIDFGNPALSMPAINDWIIKATRNMIRSMSDSPPSPLTRLLVLNAIFFKGIWKTQFPIDMTFNGRFFTVNGEEKRVLTMVLYNETFLLHRSNAHRHTFLKLPYQGDEISMVIALPYSFREKPMTLVSDQILCYVRDAMKETRMDTVSFPKFRFEYTIPLKESLQRLGITNMFDPNMANLSKLRKQNDVFVEGIRHKAVIEVNEQGTSAAAVTAVKLVPLSYRNTTDFLANHPFAFYIIHEPSGLVLFYGKMYDTTNVQPSRNSGIDGAVAQPVRNQGLSDGGNGASESARRNRVRSHGAISYDDEN